MTDQLRAAIAAIDGIIEGESMFKDDLAYWVNGKEIAHFESDQILDIRLSRAVIRQRRAEIQADQRIRLRSNSSDWVTVTVDGPDSLDLITTLMGWAAEAHRAPAGTIPKPPPAGPDLARRKRFH